MDTQISILPEELVLLDELDKYAKKYDQFPYIVSEEILFKDYEGGEGEFRLAKNIEDGETYIAKIRFNPRTDKRNMNDEKKIVDDYKRFIKEVERMSHCYHRNIVQLRHALRDTKEDLYIIMDLYDVDLEYRIKKDIEEKGGPIEEEQLIYILAQILDGMNYLHGEDISHGDINP